MPHVCTTPDTAIIGTFVDDGKGNYLGECVSLVKRQCATLRNRQKKDWKSSGRAVKGNADLTAGTAVASYDDKGTPGHAAIYISQDADGIWVWDQYNATSSKPAGKKVGRSFIRFKNVNYPRYDADKYFVIE